MELSDDKLKNIVDNMLSLLHLPGLIDTEGKVKQSIDNILKVIIVQVKIQGSL
jgi:hypothetical protein